MLEKIIQGLETFLNNLLAAVPRYVIGLLVLVGGFYLIKFIIRIIDRRFTKRKIDQSLHGFLLSLIRIASYIILFTIVIGIVGFRSMSLAAIFGAVGLTVGLALQGSLSNFAGGVLILLFRPFKVGDYITNNGDTVGTVQKIDLLYTTLKNDSGLIVFSPNGALANSVITNYSEIASRRYNFELAITYSADISEVRSTILKALAANETVLKQPAPLVFVSKLDLGADKVVLNIIIWIKKENYWNTVFAIQQRIKEALDGELATDISPIPGVRIKSS